MKTKINNTKKTMVALAVLTCISSAFMIKCSSPAQNLENARENVDEANAELKEANLEYIEDIENYRLETAETIMDNEQVIRQERKRMATQSKENNAINEKKINELEQKNRELKKSMDEYEPDGRDNWEKFKSEFAHDMNELGVAFKSITVNNMK